jgi:hypothetical protein
LWPLLLLGAVAGLLPALADPMIAFGAVAGIAVTFLVLHNPRIGLLLVAATIPLEVGGHVGRLTKNLPLTIPKILTLLTLGSWFVHLTLGRARYRRLPWMYWLIVFWVISILSLIGAKELASGLEAVFRLLTTCLFFFLIVQLVDSEKMLKTCLAVFLICGALAASYALYQRFSSGSRHAFRIGWEEESARRFGVEQDIVEQHMVGIIERSSGVSMHSILLALNVSLMLAPLLAFLRNVDRRESIRRLFWGGLLAVFLASVVVTYARTGFLLVLFCGFFVWRRKLVSISASALLLFTLGVAALCLFAPERYFDRVLDLESYSLKSKSITTRVEAQKAVFQQFLDHPILGVGYGNRYNIFEYFIAYPDKRHAVTPHNAYLQVAGQMGLIGLVVLCVFFWKAHVHTLGAVRRFRALGRRDMVNLGNALNISMLCFLFSGLALDLFDKGMPHGWLMIGLCAAYQHLAHEESPEHEAADDATAPATHDRGDRPDSLVPESP